MAHQALLSVGFSRQEDWSGLPFPSPGDLPDPRIKPESPALQVTSLPLGRQEVIHVLVSILPQNPLPSRLPQNRAESPVPKPFWKFTNALWLSGPSPAWVRPAAAFHSNTWAAGREKMNFRRGKLSKLKGQVKRTLGSRLPQPPTLGCHAPLPGFAWGPPGWLILTQGDEHPCGFAGPPRQVGC